MNSSGKSEDLGLELNLPQPYGKQVRSGLQTAILSAPQSAPSSTQNTSGPVRDSFAIHVTPILWDRCYVSILSKTWYSAFKVLLFISLNDYHFCGPWLQSIHRIWLCHWVGGVVSWRFKESGSLQIFSLDHGPSQSLGHRFCCQWLIPYALGLNSYLEISCCCPN